MTSSQMTMPRALDCQKVENHNVTILDSEIEEDILNCLNEEGYKRNTGKSKKRSQRNNDRDCYSASFSATSSSAASDSESNISFTHNIDRSITI